MRAPGEAELLALWERGQRRHPIDRALLLGGWACPDLPPSRLADLPLGTLNAALLRLREACFGPEIQTYLDCDGCGARLDLVLDAEALSSDAGTGDASGELAVAGLRFRRPCSRDLAAVADERDPEAAALRLLEQCCIERPDGPAIDLAGLLAAVEDGLEALDPTASIELAVACEVCGHRSIVGFDIGTLLWDEIDARARALLAEVHGLAQAYGWSESEILALSPQRRAVYLEMVSA